jgi:hypothetical protein
VSHAAQLAQATFTTSAELCWLIMIYASDVKRVFKHARMMLATFIRMVMQINAHFAFTELKKD